jgi:hypothetical protein
MIDNQIHRVVAQRWQLTLTANQVLNILKFKVMRSIYITLIVTFVSLSTFSQITSDTTFSKQWNSETQNWEAYSRTITTFSNGLVSSERVEIFQGNKWVNYSFKGYYYNNGNVIEKSEQYWNDSKLKWVDNFRMLYSYDENGNLIKLLHQNYYDGKFVSTRKEKMDYYPNGELKEKIIQKINEDQAWSNFLRYQYYYNANDLLIEENLTYWENNDWDENSYATNYSYDNSGNLTSKTKVYCNKNKKENSTKEEFIYGDDNELQEYAIYNWTKKHWTKRNRVVYSNNDNSRTILSQVWSKNEWANYTSTELPGDYKTDASVNDLDYSISFDIRSKRIGTKAIIEFDNPYNERYFVQVVNENGLIVNAETTNGNEISIDSYYLEGGLYYIELQGSNSFSGKFSIE